MPREIYPQEQSPEPYTGLEGSSEVDQLTFDIRRGKLRESSNFTERARESSQEVGSGGKEPQLQPVAEPVHAPLIDSIHQEPPEIAFPSSEPDRIRIPSSLASSRAQSDAPEDLSGQVATAQTFQQWYCVIKNLISKLMVRPKVRISYSRIEWICVSCTQSLLPRAH